MPRGAVLIAKLSLGALAMDDLWGDKAHAVRTRNPWNTRQGSSGSSAGSASRNLGGMRGVLNRDGDPGIDLLALDALRSPPACGPALAWCRAPARWR